MIQSWIAHQHLFADLPMQNAKCKLQNEKVSADRFKNEASTGLHPWYPSFLRRNPPKHPPSLFELRRVRHEHSFTGLRPWSSAKADKSRRFELSYLKLILFANLNRRLPIASCRINPVYLPPGLGPCSPKGSGL